MICPTRRKAWLAIAIVAALTAVPATASAAATASDEYVLEIPGFRQANNGLAAGSAATANDAGDDIQRGVVGEQDPPPTPLATLGDAVSSFPGAFAAGLLALAAIALLSISSRRSSSHATR